MSEKHITMRSEERIRLLTRENELLNSIIQDASDSIYVKDFEGRYITINQAGAGYFDRNIDQIIGKTDAEFSVSESVIKLIEDDTKLFKYGNSVSYENGVGFGSENSYFLTTKTPLRDSNENVIGLIGVSRNVTAARLSEEKYRFTF
jgi:transcriptional regulator with PAS, ATPase and Fis domain